MKILIVHNSYQIKGGEDSVVESEVQLLKNFGHEVKLAKFNNDSIIGLISKLKAAVDIFYSRRAKKIINDKVVNFKPDIIHVHNFFPMVTPSVYDVAYENNLPIVQTLHNFRIVCPNGLFLLHGKECNKCINGKFYNAITNKCYRNSYIGSAIVAMFDHIHKKKNTWNEKVTKFVALSEFAKSKFIQGGIVKEKLLVKPNFVENTSCRITEKKDYGLFVGRLSEEKGINILIDAIKNTNYPFKIVGDGPLYGKLNSSSNIEFLGRKSIEEINELMRNALFLVVPSICYENFPRTIVEAYSNHLAVIGSDHGSIGEIIDDGVNGMVFEVANSDSLNKKIKYAFENKTKMIDLGHKAYECYVNKYTHEKNYHSLMSIYESLIDAKRDGK